MYTREQIINRGRELNASTDKINEVLNKVGYDSIPTLGGLGENALRNAKEFGRDFRTMSGAIVKPITDLSDEVYFGIRDKNMDRVKNAFSKAVNNDNLRRTASGAIAGGVIGSAFPIVGTFGGSVLGGAMGMFGPKGVADSILSTYNTNTNELFSGKTDPKKVLRGMYENPLYAGMDILSLGGAKALAKGGNALSKAMPTNTPLSVQAILPSKGLRDFNRHVTDVISESNNKRAGMYKGYSTLDAMPLANREGIVRKIVTNEGKLSKLDEEVAQAIKKDLIANEQDAITRGLLNKDLAKQNVISQYVMAKLYNKYPTLIHDDVYRYLNGTGTIRPETMTPELLDDIAKVAKEGEALYNNKDIAFLTQALAGSTDPLGLVTANEIAKEGKGYFGTKRIIGRTSAKDLSKVLDKSVKHQLAQIAKAVKAQDVITELVSGNRGVGTPLVGMPKGYKVPKGKVAINIEEFNKKLNKAISEDGEANIGKILRGSEIARDGSYIVDKVYADALKNVFTPSSLGKVRKFTNAFKKAVLANPHWFWLNRIGNFTNNAVGGVKAIDYADAFRNAKLVPDRLYQQTSFNSYINSAMDGLNQSKISSVKQPINRLVRGVEEFKDSDKSLSNLGNLIGNTYSSVSDITANPIFRWESGFERADRYANMIRQAKKLGKETKRNWKDIIKEANNNDKLYNTLNKGVNLDLGDYLGRNYAIPNGVYDILGETVPFYRFLTQTGRTTAHQLANHGLAFDAGISFPARAGHDLSEYIIDRFGLDPEKYEGGVPYRALPDGSGVRTLGVEPLPIQAILEDVYGIGSATDMSSLISPLWTMGSDILNYKKNGKYTPTSPELNRMKLIDPDSAKYYKPSLNEAIRYGANQILGTTTNPYRMLTMYAPEIMALGTGQGLQSRYDTNPLTENPMSYKKQGPTELIGRHIALQTRSIPKKFRPSRSAMIRNIRKGVRNKNKMELMKGDKR